MDIVLECQKSDVLELDPLRDHGLAIVEVRRFDSNPDLLHALISLTAVTAPLVTSVMITLIRARKHVKIIFKDFEISGVSEANAVDLIKNLLAHDSE